MNLQQIIDDLNSSISWDLVCIKHNISALKVFAIAIGVQKDKTLEEIQSILDKMGNRQLMSRDIIKMYQDLDGHI